MGRGRILICALALALAQVPWIPCHCGEGCAIRPLLVATSHDCEDPDHAVIHRRCPAHGCAGHKAEHHAEEPVRAPDHDGDDEHDHSIFLLQAVTAPAAPGLPLGTAASWLASVQVPAVAAPRAHLSARLECEEEATGPPRALATIRLLV